MLTNLSGAFALWAPNVYGYYKDHLDAMYGRLPYLTRNFRKSIFPCATINFGPNAWTFKHHDVLNCPFGWCAIQALGEFNPKLGGHLILWDVKLVIEFPPAATILIPSATLLHSNIPIQSDECRASFTQYCSGAIFRWVDNGFRTVDDLKAQDPKEYERLSALKETWWLEGLGLLSTMDDLLVS